MWKPIENVLEEIRSKAHEMNLSEQQARIVELVLEHRTVAEIAGLLGITPASVYRQIARIRDKAHAVRKRKAFEHMAEEAKSRLKSTRAQIVFLRQKGCSLKLISELLGVKYQKVADTIRRATGRYWIVEVPPPGPEQLVSPPPEKCPLFQTAVSVYYHSFISGDVDPDSQEGRYRLLCAASGGAGGWRARQVLLKERAQLTKEWAERSRATRTRRAHELLQAGQTPAPTWQLVRLPESPDGKSRREVPDGVRHVLNNWFVKITPDCWRPRDLSSWRRLFEATGGRAEWRKTPETTSCFSESTKQLPSVG